MDDTSYPNPRMPDAEFRRMVKLLREFADVELDQWVDWKMPSKHGDVFIKISRAPIDPDLPLEFYGDLSKELD